MPYEYEINDLAKEDSWRMFRIIGELVEGFDKLADVAPAVSIYGSARIKEGDELYQKTVEITSRLGEFSLNAVKLALFEPTMETMVFFCFSVTLTWRILFDARASAFGLPAESSKAARLISAVCAAARLATQDPRLTPMTTIWR